MKRTLTGRTRKTEAGSTLLIALLTTASLSVVVGLSLVNLTSRSQTAARSAAWQQAGLAAESAADLAVAEIRRVLPDLAPTITNPWSGYTATDGAAAVALPTGKTLDSALTLTFSPAALVHGGEGMGTEKSTAIVDAPAGMTDSSGRQWLRVRASGTTLIPGWRGPSRSKLDNQLRGIAFVRDWHSGALVSQPQVTRWLEATVQPVPLYDGALIAQGPISLTHTQSLVDSFDSGDATKSTSGLYDSQKRQKHGTVVTNGAALTLNGAVYGDVGSGGGTQPNMQTLDGSFDSNTYHNLPAVVNPASSFNLFSFLFSLPLGFALDLVGDLTAGAASYQLLNVSGTLNLKGVAGASVDLWVKGDLTGQVRLYTGVKSSLYVSGNMRLDSGDLRNDTQRAANLQVLGVTPTDGSARTMTIALGSDIYASIYAPGHDVVFTGNGSFFGAVIAKSVTAAGKAKFHFDEALRRLPHPIADYKVATVVEEVR